MMDTVKICAHIDAYDPKVIDLLEKVDEIQDLDAAVDLTIETVIRIREEIRQSDQYLWIQENHENGMYQSISTRGISQPRPPYTYHRYNLKEQFYDGKKMLLEGFWAGIPALRGGGISGNLSTRPNFGTITGPSIFDGIEYGVFTDIMPWISRHSSKEEVRRFADRYDSTELPELGVMPLALEQVGYFREKLEGLDIGIGEVNNQSPFDIAHQVRGDQFFYDLYDDGAFVHELMELCTKAYLDIFNIVEEAAGRTGKRAIAYCDDSSVLVSEPLFLEYSLPYLYELGKHFEAVGVHYCGKGHLDQHYFECPKVATVNLGQPEFFDYQSYITRVMEAGKVYSGGWPVLPEDDSAEDYLRRILAPLDKDRECIRFAIQGYECGVDSSELCRLWYELQGAPPIHQ